MADESDTASTKPTPVREAMSPDTGDSDDTSADVKARGRDAALQAVRDAVEVEEQPRDEEGKFASKDAPSEAADDADPPAAEADAEDSGTGDAEGAPPTPESDADASAVPSGEGEQVSQEGVPDGFVRLELPEDHPLRDRGREYIVAEEGSEDEYRNVINQPVKNSQLEELQTQNQRLQTQLQQIRQKAREEQAAREALDSEDVKQLEDPELINLLDDIERTYGEEQANTVREALEAKKQQAVQERVDETRSEAEMEQMAQQFQAGVTQLVTQNDDLFSVWRESGELQPRLQRAMLNYGQLVDQGMAQPDPAQFIDWAWRNVYAEDPRVQQKANQMFGNEAANEGSAPDSLDDLPDELVEQLTERAVERLQQGRSEEADKMAEAAQKRDQNPQGQMGRADTGARTPRPSDSEEVDLEGMSGDKVQQTLKERLFPGTG